MYSQKYIHLYETLIGIIKHRSIIIIININNNYLGSNETAQSTFQNECGGLLCYKIPVSCSYKSSNNCFIILPLILYKPYFYFNCKSKLPTCLKDKLKVIVLI